MATSTQNASASLGNSSLFLFRFSQAPLLNKCPGWWFDSTNLMQSAIGGWVGGFHTARGSIDPADPRFRPEFVGVAADVRRG